MSSLPPRESMTRKYEVRTTSCQCLLISFVPLPRPDKRPKCTEPQRCLHCGSNDHDWPRCTSPCLHCNTVFHPHGRCFSLGVEHYTPGGFNVPAPSSKSATSLISDIKVKKEAEETAIPETLQNITAYSPNVGHSNNTYDPRDARDRHNQSNNTEGLNIGRAVGVANVPHAPSIKEEPSGSSQGLHSNTPPRDPRKVGRTSWPGSATVPAKTSPPAGPSAPSSFLSTPGSTNVVLPATAADGRRRQDANNAGQCMVRASPYFPNSKPRPRPIEPRPIGQSAVPVGPRISSGTIDPRQAAIPQFGPPRAASKPFAPTPQQSTTSGPPAKSAQLRQPSLAPLPTSPLPAQARRNGARDIKHEHAVWNALKTQIEEAVETTAAKGKSYNGLVDRTNIQRKVETVLGILKPIITGGDPPPDGMVSADAVSSESSHHPQGPDVFKFGNATMTISRSRQGQGQTFEFHCRG